jgi:hypothetical protein
MERGRGCKGRGMEKGRGCKGRGYGRGKGMGTFHRGHVMVVVLCSLACCIALHHGAITSLLCWAIVAIGRVWG